MAISNNQNDVTLMDESGNSIQYARIQMRRGLESQLDVSKMLPAEFAVTTDTEKVHVAFSPGKTKQLMTVDDALEEVQEKADEILETLPEDYTHLEEKVSSLSEEKVGSTNITINSIDDLSDFNNAKYNTIYAINAIDIPNMPVSKKGTLITLTYNALSSDVTGGLVQLYITSDNIMYHRVTKFISTVSWSTWEEVVSNIRLTDSLTANLKKCLSSYIIVNSTNDLGDFDSAIRNKVYTINTTGIKNSPVDKKGVLITISSQNAIDTLSGGVLQMFYTADNEIYTRTTAFSNPTFWIEWRKITTTTVNELPNHYNGFEYSVFNKTACCGDSTTEGAMNYNGNSGNNTPITKYSYPTQLAKMSGVETVNLGKSGYSTKQWYEFYKEIDLSGYDSAILMLGINDPNRNISESESTQSLINIINKFKNENKGIKIFICSILPTYFKAGSNNYNYYETICNSMKEICNTMDNCFFVDINKYSRLTEDLSNGHPTAIGYNGIAKDLYCYISYIIKNNIEKFKDIQFIGTDYTI